MRFNKRVALTGQAPICPIELSDLVVGMNHLGWAPVSPQRFVLRRSSPFVRPVRVLRQALLRIRGVPDQEVKRGSVVSHWIEAEVDESSDQRTLVLHGRIPLSERRKLDALLEALQQGRRWLTREGPLG
ncbi:MAG TPA: hypothetical protein VE983_11665 [Solirubrobacteraceae bacterium]|nr:hypothetical protein [Solirubrobacteraceae bacterium]